MGRRRKRGKRRRRGKGRKMKRGRRRRRRTYVRLVSITPQKFAWLAYWNYS
jgi:hypothetical protein